MYSLILPEKRCTCSDGYNTSLEAPPNKKDYFSDKPTGKEAKLLEDYRQMFQSDPKALGMKKSEVEQELRLYHSSYEPLQTNTRIPTEQELEKFQKEQPQEFQKMQDKAKQNTEQIIQGTRKENAENTITEVLQKQKISDAELLLLNDKKRNEITSLAGKELNDVSNADEAFDKVRADALKNAVDKTSGFEKDIERTAKELGSEEDMKSDKFREKVKNKVLNERLNYSITQLSADQRELYALQGKRGELISKLSQPLSAEGHVKLASELTELDKKIQTRRNGFNNLYDPLTGEYIDTNDAPPEQADRARAFEKRINREMLKYQDTDVGTLTRSWNTLLSNLRYVNDVLGNEKTIRVPGEKMMSVNEVSKLLRQTQEMGMGFGVPLSGDAAEKLNNYNKLYLDTKAKFDAVNRALLLNQDPSKVDKNFMGLFFEHAVESFGKEVKSDTDFIENFVTGIKETGGVVTKAQEEAAKDDLGDQIAKGMGDSVRPMAELILTSYVTAGLGSVPTLSRFGNLMKSTMIDKWGKTGEFGYNVISRQLQGAVSYGLASDQGLSSIMGAGEGTVQGIMDTLNPEKWFEKSKYGKLFELGTRTLVGMGEETAQEFAGDYLDNLKRSGYNWDKAFEQTFGRTPGEFADKAFVIASISGMFSGAFNTGTLLWAKNEIAHSDSPYKEEYLQSVDENLKQQNTSEKKTEEQIASTKDIQGTEAVKKENKPEETGKQGTPLQENTLPEEKQPRIFNPKEEAAIREAVSKQGIEPKLSAQDAFEKNVPVMDLGERWVDASSQFDEKVKQPKETEIKKLQSQIEELKKDKSEQASEKRKNLTEQIGNLKQEISDGEKMIENESLIFGDDIWQKIKQKTIERGYDLDELQRKGIDLHEFKDSMMLGLFDDTHIQSYHNQPLNKVTENLIDKFMANHKIQPVNYETKIDKVDIGNQHINPAFRESKVVKGKETKIRMPNKEVRDAEFAVVEANSIIASHDETSFSNSKGYPTEGGTNVNPRNYKGDAVAQQQVEQNARELDPYEVISNSANPSTGVPIISPDGIVMSGNGRTMSIKKAIRQFQDKYEEYKQHLKQEAPTYGISQEQLADFKHPILVKIDKATKEYSIKELDRYNKKTQKEEAEIDKSIKLSKILEGNKKATNRILEIIGQYDTMSDFFNDKQSQNTIKGILQNEEIILGQELNKYVDADGTFNTGGKSLLQDVLLGLVLNEKTILVSEIEGVKQFRRNIVNAIPVLTKNFTLGDYSIKKELNKAVELQARYKQSGIEDFSTFVVQQDIFEDFTDADVIRVNRAINLGQKTFKDIVRIINASAELSNAGGGLLGDSEVISKEETISKSLEQKLKKDESNAINKIISFSQSGKTSPSGQGIQGVRKGADQYIQPSESRAGGSGATEDTGGSEQGTKPFDKPIYGEQQITSRGTPLKTHFNALVSSLQKTFPNLKVVTDKTEFSQAFQKALPGKKNAPLGFTYKGRIFINPDKATLDTPVHEFGHLFMGLVKDNYAELYHKGLKLIEGTNYFEQAKKDYPHRSRKAQLEEALVQAIGEKGANLFMEKEARNESLTGKLQNWTGQFWDNIQRKLKIKPSIELENLTLEEYTKLMAGELVRGIPLTRVTSEQLDKLGRQEVVIEGGILSEQSKVSEWSNKLYRKWFAKEGLLPKPVYERKVAMEGKINKEIREMENRVNDIRNIIRKNYPKKATTLLQDINNALTKNKGSLKTEDYNKLPADLAPIVQGMREHVDNLSMQFISSGLVEGDIAAKINENMEVYLHRSYRLFDDPKWAEKVSPDIVTKAKQFIRNRYERGRVASVQFIKNTDATYTVKVKTIEGFENTQEKLSEAKLREFLGDEIADQVKNTSRSKGYIRNIPEGLEIGDKVSVEASSDEIQGIVNKLLNPDKTEAFIKGGKLGSKDLSILKNRKDIAPEIKALWGEYTDPAAQYTNTVLKMANAVYKHRFLQEVKNIGLGNFLFDENHPTSRNYQKIAADQSSVMSPLNGLYTRPEIKEAFETALKNKDIDGWVKLAYTLNGLVKVNKTVFSHVTQERNFISASFFAIANGNINASKLKDSIGAISANMGYSKAGGKTILDLDAWRKKYNRYLELKVADESVDVNDLKTMMKEAFEAESTEKLFLGIKDQFELKNTIKKAVRFASKIYSASDDFWKIFNFENELDRLKRAYPEKASKERIGELEKEAAEIVRKTTPTYSQLPKAIKELRKFPFVGSFVSFPYSILVSSSGIISQAKKEIANPRTRKAGIQRLAGVLSVGLITGGIQMVSMAMNDIGDDEDDLLRLFDPEWSKNSHKFHLGRKGNGLTYSYIDLSFMDPYNYLKKWYVALNNKEELNRDAAIESVKEFFQPYISEEILTERILDVSRNKKKNGGEVYNPEDPEWLTDVTKHVSEGIEPGSITSLRRLAYAYLGTQTPTGRTYDLENELMANAFGMRITELNIPASLRFKTYRYKDQLENAQKIFNDEYYRQGKDRTEETLRAAYNKANEIKHKHYEEMQQLVGAAKKLGMSGQQIREVLKETKLSNEEINSILRLRGGEYLPGDFKKFNDTRLKKALKNLSHK